MTTVQLLELLMVHLHEVCIGANTFTLDLPEFLLKGEFPVCLLARTNEMKTFLGKILLETLLGCQMRFEMLEDQLPDHVGC